MNLLLLGGTQFVGRHITADALERGHHVTLFNRGITNAALFPGAETMIGNRDGGLEELRGREWDAVIVVGPYAHTDRWTSWMRRVARGGERLAPGRPDAPVQFIDGRDLAGFTVSMAERRGTGIYNTTGPAQPLAWRELFETAKRVTRADATLTWVPLDFLRAHGVQEEQLPMGQSPEGEAALLEKWRAQKTNHED